MLLQVLVVQTQLHMWADAGGQQEESKDDRQQQEDLQAAVDNSSTGGQSAPPCLFVGLFTALGDSMHSADKLLLLRVQTAMFLPEQQDDGQHICSAQCVCVRCHEDVCQDSNIHNTQLCFVAHCDAAYGLHIPHKGTAGGQSVGACCGTVHSLASSMSSYPCPPACAMHSIHTVH